MTKPRKIKVTEAAALMQKTPLFVYEAMRREAIDIGIAMQMPGSTKWTFHISPPKLAAYLGVTVEELMGMLGGAA